MIEQWRDFYTTPDGVIWQRKNMYYCDPGKNSECTKSRCKYLNHGECEGTFDESCAMRSAEGWPLVMHVLTRKRTEADGNGV